MGEPTGPRAVQRSKGECDALRRRVLEEVNVRLGDAARVRYAPRNRLCQVCGEVWKVQSLGHLLAARGPGGEPICRDCMPSPWAATVLNRSTRRWCTVCLGRVSTRSAVRVHDGWVCGPCRRAARALDLPDALERMRDAAEQVHAGRELAPQPEASPRGLPRVRLRPMSARRLGWRPAQVHSFYANETIRAVDREARVALARAAARGGSPVAPIRSEPLSIDTTYGGGIDPEPFESLAGSHLFTLGWSPDAEHRGHCRWLAYDLAPHLRLYVEHRGDAVHTVAAAPHPGRRADQVFVRRLLRTNGAEFRTMVLSSPPAEVRLSETFPRARWLEHLLACWEKFAPSKWNFWREFPQLTNADADALVCPHPPTSPCAGGPCEVRADLRRRLAADWLAAAERRELRVLVPGRWQKHRRCKSCQRRLSLDNMFGYCSGACASRGLALQRRLEEDLQLH